MVIKMVISSYTLSGFGPNIGRYLESMEENGMGVIERGKDLYRRLYCFSTEAVYGCNETVNRVTTMLIYGSFALAVMGTLGCQGNFPVHKAPEPPGSGIGELFKGMKGPTPTPTPGPGLIDQVREFVSGTPTPTPTPTPGPGLLDRIWGAFRGPTSTPTPTPTPTQTPTPGPGVQLPGMPNIQLPGMPNIQLPGIPQDIRDAAGTVVHDAVEAGKDIGSDAVEAVQTAAAPTPTYSGPYVPSGWEGTATPIATPTYSGPYVPSGWEGTATPTPTDSPRP